MVFEKIINEKLSGSKKGQAMMEYLMTYGLALFVILIVLAILVTVVLPSLKGGEQCTFTQAGFSCNQKQAVLTAGSGNVVSLLFQLDNGKGRDVIINRTLCTTAPIGNVVRDTVNSRGTAVAGGSSTMVAGATSNFNIPCIDENGRPVTLAPNSNFKGTLAITYNYVDEVSGAPARLDVATVSGTIQQG